MPMFRCAGGMAASTSLATLADKNNGNMLSTVSLMLHIMAYLSPPKPRREELEGDEGQNGEEDTYLLCQRD